MEVSEITVKTVQCQDLPWKEVKIMPVGDLHSGSQGFARDRLKRHIEWGVKNDCYFIGMGDQVDVASPGNRHRIRTASLYDSVEDMMEEAAMKAVEDVADILKGTEGRWLGLVEGHHFWEFANGETSDTLLAEKLGAPFLGNCAFVRLRFDRGSSIVCTLWVHHGSGGGQKAASPLYKLENLTPYFDADIYLIGHTHKKAAAPISQLYLNNRGDIKHRKKILACTGSFLKAYTQGSERHGRAQGDYVEKRLLSPATLGGVLLRVRPIRISTGDRLDITVEL